MHLAQTLDEIRKHVAELEANLAEADALISLHQTSIDPNPIDKWPQDSALKRAISRHTAREVYRLKDEYTRAAIARARG